MAAVQNLCAKGILLDKGKILFAGGIEQTIIKYSQITSTLSNTDISLRQDRNGNLTIKLTKVSFFNDLGEEIQHILSGQSIVIRIDYFSEKEIEKANVLIAFNVTTNLGFLLTNLNSVDTGDQTMDIFRKGFFECHWPNTNLRSGMYECSLFCSIDGEIADWVQNAFKIVVEDGDFFGTGRVIERTQGEIFVDHSWTSRRR
jgi:lipopolysaccharide transport system ATP-binding protein